MKDAPGQGRLSDEWDDARAAPLSEPELLLYRSHLLGSDKRVTNFGGGNTWPRSRRRTRSTGAS